MVLLIGLPLVGWVLRSGLSDTVCREDGIKRAGHPLIRWQVVKSYRLWEGDGPGFSLTLVAALPMGLATETDVRLLLSERYKHEVEAIITKYVGAPAGRTIG